MLQLGALHSGREKLWVVFVTETHYDEVFQYLCCKQGGIVVVIWPIEKYFSK